MTATAYGDRAVRCVVDDLAAAHRLHALLHGAGLPGVLDVVPAWRSVVVAVATENDLQAVVDYLAQLDDTTAPTAPARTHELVVHYDGPDLADVAEHTRLSVDEVVRRHAAGDYVVAFLGFSPGFPYLAGLDPALATPRRATPRTSVPGGAVAIADDVTGIYPTASPGGWQVIGHVDAALFDVTRNPPALLAPGDRVRFVPR